MRLPSRIPAMGLPLASPWVSVISALTYVAERPRSQCSSGRTNSSISAPWVSASAFRMMREEQVPASAITCNPSTLVMNSEAFNVTRPSAMRVLAPSS